MKKIDEKFKTKVKGYKENWDKEYWIMDFKLDEGIYALFVFPEDDVKEAKANKSFISGDKKGFYKSLIVGDKNYSMIQNVDEKWKQRSKDLFEFIERKMMHLFVRYQYVSI